MIYIIYFKNNIIFNFKNIKLLLYKNNSLRGSPT